jgi:hypothetical protein
MPITGVLPTKATYYKIINRQTGLYSCKGMWHWDEAGHIFTSMALAKGHITRCVNYYKGYYGHNRGAVQGDEYKNVELQYVDLIEVDIVEKDSSSVKEMHEKRTRDRLDRLKRKAERVAAKTKKAEEKEHKRLERMYKKGMAPKPEPAKVTLRL